MHAHLQATGLDVWRVVNEGIQNTSRKQNQNDVIAKSIILSYLGDSVFNRVFTCENVKELWETIKENNEGTKDVANERYHVLIDKLNSFKQLDDKNAESMYSRLNILVNEINSLGVKQIEDVDIIRKILHSLWRLDYIW